MRNTRRLSLAFSVALAFVALSFVGCREVDVVDGEIPDEYLSAAQKYMGVYSGRMDGASGQLTISLNGNKPVVTYRDATGTDILDPKCQSRIGNLVAVRVKEKRGQHTLQSARFAFSPNRCTNVEGRDLILQFKENSSGIRVDASILLFRTWEQICHTEPGDPARGIPPYQRCENRPVERYIEGRFRK